MGTHGMLLVGTETIYLSHLPMFMSPHNFQVILEVTLSDDAGRLLGDFQAHFGSASLFTFKPEDFAITDLVSRDPGEPLTSFTGDLYHGHFERGGDDIAKDAVVHVENVIHFGELTPDLTKPSELVYLLFGKGQELFLAHLISQPPDFDQVLSIQLGTASAQVTDDDLLRGVRATFLGRPNTPHRRIKPGEKLAAQGHVTGAHQFLDLQLEVLAEIYVEEGELSKSMTM